MQNKTLVLIITVIAITLSVGLCTKVYLGDEGYHYRQAKLYNLLEARPVCDPVYQNLPKLGYNFSDGPLWYTGLAMLWQLVGSNSFYIAQIYHMAFFSILLFSLYFLAKEMYQDNVAILSIILLSSIPLVAILGIVFYLDIPVTAFLTLSLYLLYRKHYIISGLIIGLAVLTKVNSLFLVLPFLVLAFSYSKGNFFKKAISVIKFILPCSLINIPDAIFRYKNLGYIYYTAPKYLPKGIDYYSPGLITNGLLNVFRLLGIALFVSLCLYIILRRFHKKDMFLVVPVVGYLFFFVVLFRRNMDVRYLIPILPLLAILAAKGISFLKKPLVTGLVITICASQFLFTLGFIYKTRQIPEGIKIGFDFIKKDIPQHAVIMYPEENLVTYTNHPIAWGRVLEISDLFWGESEEKMFSVLDDYSIKYIAVKRSRVYDDSKVKHTGGYPASFVNKLPSLTFLNLLFENEELSIWQVNKAG